MPLFFFITRCTTFITDVACTSNLKNFNSVLFIKMFKANVLGVSSQELMAVEIVQICLILTAI
jgi:hypothetical protein